MFRHNNPLHMHTLLESWRLYIRHYQLQIALWSLWSALVVGVAAATWWHAHVLHQHVAVIGLCIHCLLAGVIGLIALTKVEMRLEPERFEREDGI